MANTTINGSFQGDGKSYYAVRCVCYSTSNGDKANSSNVTVKLQMRRTYGTADGGDWQWNETGSAIGRIVINGNDSGNCSVKFNTKWNVDWIDLTSYTVKNIPHDTDGTKTINISAEFHPNATSYLTNGKVEGSFKLDNLDRIAPKITVKINSVNATSVTFSASADVACESYQYTFNGTKWYSVSIPSNFTKTGLTPNTEYALQVRAVKSSNGVYGASSATTFVTKGNTLLNSVNTLTIDVATPIITMFCTAYASYTHTLTIKDGATTVLTIDGLSCGTGTNVNKAIKLTDEQRTTILQYMTNKSSFDASFELTTYSGTSQIGTSRATATIKTTPENSAPTFVDFNHRDYNRDGTADITGNNQIYIKGETK